MNIDLLLQQSQLHPIDLKQLLRDETFDRLAIICKTGGKIDLLRSLLQKHKRQEVTVRVRVFGVFSFLCRHLIGARNQRLLENGNADTGIVNSWKTAMERDESWRGCKKMA